MTDQPIVKITDLGAHGDGIGRLPDGRTVFVEDALPDEDLHVKLQKQSGGKQGGLRGTIDQVLKPSPDRQSPPCAHYDVCGGCQMQHVTDDFYQNWKQQRIQSIFADDITPETQILSPIFVGQGTRRRATFTCIKTKNNVVVGFNQRKSHFVADIQDCLTLDPVLETLRKQLKTIIGDIVPDGKAIDVFVQNIDGIVDCVITGALGRDRRAKQALDMVCGRLLSETAIGRVSWRLKPRHTPELLMQQDSLYKRMGKYNVTLTPQAFLQPSIEGENALVAAVLDAVKQTGGQKLADLFAGYGTFTGALAQAGYAVDAFEWDEIAMQVLRKAGHGQSFPRDLFHLPLREEELKKYDVVVLDPPRAGAKEQMEKLAYADVAHIVYVSCNPVSCAKDIAALANEGFVLKSLQLVDQFAWSTHAEVVIRLQKF